MIIQLILGLSIVVLHITWHVYANFRNHASLYGEVQLLNWVTSAITHCGSCYLGGALKLGSILYASNFRYNFLSVSQLVKEFGITINFLHNITVLQDHSNGKVMRIEAVHKWLYVLKVVRVNDCDCATFCYSLRSTPPCTYQSRSGLIRKGVVILVPDDIVLLHQRLGHMSLHKLKCLFGFDPQFSMDVTNCLVCPLAKQTQLSFSLALLEQRVYLISFTWIFWDLIG